MDAYACPHCGKSLRGKLLKTVPAPGERKFLPLNGITLCPFCRGQLFNNPHPAELKFAFAAAPFLILPSLGKWLFPESPGFMALLGIALLFVAGAAAFVHWKALRNWPRFSATPKKLDFNRLFRR